MKRPTAESCQRLTGAALRRVVAPGAAGQRLADGTTLRLSWRPVRGCWGGREGRELLLSCPGCQSWRRALHRPPGDGWRCWGCRPLSTASHRRSGSRRGQRKPTSWETARIEAAQTRIAALLGLVAWPPPGLPLLWSLQDLWPLAAAADRPRLSPDRQIALLLRLAALETLRLVAGVPAALAELEALGAGLQAAEGLPEIADQARGIIGATGWAIRRPARDLARRDVVLRG